MLPVMKCVEYDQRDSGADFLGSDDTITIQNVCKMTLARICVLDGGDKLNETGFHTTTHIVTHLLDGW